MADNTKKHSLVNECFLVTLKDIEIHNIHVKYKTACISHFHDDAYSSPVTGLTPTL